MSRRGGVVGLVASILIACVCAGLIAWRLTPPRPRAPAPPAPVAPSPVATPEPAVRLSTIIDLPGDPVLVRRGAVLAPKDALISVPARLGQAAPQTPAKAFFVNSTLVSSTGGYMGKFQEAGQEAEALAAQLAMNSAQIAAAQNEPDTGSDDDGGADTPADAQSQFLTTANSNELEINLGGSRGQPQLKETILKPLVADTISNLLIANGFDADSARMIEGAAKDSPAHIQTLPPQSVAVAVGALDLAGAYRIKQIAIFENGEYVITIAAKDDGGYEQAAEPIIPAPLLDDSLRNQSIGTHFSIADGVYSAGIRNGMPDPVIRETIQLISRLADLRLPLQADQTLRVLFEPDFRDKGRASGKVVYVSLHGNSIAIDCYAFEGSDGAFRCFDPRAGSEGGGGDATPMPPSLGNSGATSVGGILAPIKGAPITSLYGLRFHPILHILRLHAGIDFGAAVGSPVRAAADGKIEIAGAGLRLRQPRAHPARRLRDLLFASLRDPGGDPSRRRGQAGRHHRALRQHRPFDRPAPPFRVLPEPRSRRSPAPSGLRDSDRGGVAQGSGDRDRCGNGRAGAGRHARARSPPFRRSRPISTARSRP